MTIKEYRSVLADLYSSLRSCSDPLLKSGIEQNITDLKKQIERLEAQDEQ